MTNQYAIVDLFAGAGGLGEGFAAAGREKRGNMRLALSVEMDRAATDTLRLRSFFRQFHKNSLRFYYDFLNDGGPMPDWSEIYPEKWGKAESEVYCGALGEVKTSRAIFPVLDHLRNSYSRNTILLGGPPCQAYSIMGRVKNQSVEGYVLENDKRYFLYQEYAKILKRLEPAVFVMENVRGLLSSQVNGEWISNQIYRDLSKGYRLLPLCVPVQENPDFLCFEDFLVKSENHGVPQARHRIFLVGLRNDLEGNFQVGETLLEEEDSTCETVKTALQGLSPLRSGISRGEDSHAAWKAVVFEAAKRVFDQVGDEALRKQAKKYLGNGLASFPERSCTGFAWNRNSCSSKLGDWVRDENLMRCPNHDTRSHLNSDLGRYFFASVYGEVHRVSPKLSEFPDFLQPNHKNRDSGNFVDRFRVQLADQPSKTITSHISRDGHYYIHPDPRQCRSLTVREAARLQTFPDNYFFCGSRTDQYRQVGNSVPPYLSYKVAKTVRRLLGN